MMLPNSVRTLPTLFVQAALVAAGVILAIVLVSKFVAPIPLSISQVTTQKDRAFTVTGKSVITTVPDKAQISIGISQKQNDIKQAQNLANTTMNAITDRLGALGVKKEDIKTQNYSISPNYDYRNGGQTLLGYSVDISLSVSVTDFDKLNQIVDAATAAGANQVGGVQFTLSDELQKKVISDARAEAIDDAKANAQELSRLSGIQLGKVINIVESSPTQPMPGIYMDKAMAVSNAAPGAPTNIEPGSTNYTYSVVMSYETL